MKGAVKKLEPLGTSVHSTDNRVTVCYENQDSSVVRDRLDHVTAGREMHIPGSVITSKLSTVVSTFCFPVKYHSSVFQLLTTCRL